MHLSIPETRELYSDPIAKSGQYTAYHIHCNGVFHCYVRYSKLYEFNELLRKRFKNPALAVFPPKRLLALSTEQVIQRRTQLEHWLQQISLDPAIVNSREFVDFLRENQEEVKLSCEECEIEIFLVNKKSITLQALTNDQTDEVLEAACQQLGLEEDLTYYFGLYLVKDDGGKQLSIIRPLQDFECPFISLEREQQAQEKAGKDGHLYKIQLRKAFWDTSLDENLHECDVATNLVYIQAVEDVKRKHLHMTGEQQEQLAALRKSGDKKSFVDLCGKISGYCFYSWKHVLIDFPEGQTNKVTVSIGPYEMRVTDEETGKDYAPFAVTRMRCWKVSANTASSADDEAEASDDEDDDTKDSKLSLSFDYLLKKDQLKWITLRSKSAIVMSMLLQSVVDELVRNKQGRPIRRPADRPKRDRPKLRAKPDILPPDPEILSARTLEADTKPVAAPKFDVKGEENSTTFGAITDNDL